MSDKEGRVVQRCLSRQAMAEGEPASPEAGLFLFYVTGGYESAMPIHAYCASIRRVMTRRFLMAAADEGGCPLVFIDR